jgi:hypothetical protein
MQLKYARLPSHMIYNVMSPANKSGLPDTPANAEKRAKYARLKLKDPIKQDLHTSIVAEGIKNPIVVSAGYCRPDKFPLLPKEWQENPSQILTNDTGGGNRLYYAQQHDMTIPVIINDWVDMFPEAQVINMENALALFEDKPTQVGWLEGPDIRGFFARF